VTDYILHHYDEAPFAGKIRFVFGAEQLAWRPVIQPSAMPKPKQLPLTGGYRRTPMFQVGADIYCDTRLIAAELQRRQNFLVGGASAPTRGVRNPVTITMVMVGVAVEAAPTWWGSTT